MAIQQLKIRAAQLEDFAEIRELIFAGLASRFGKYKVSANPDIERFEETYGSAVVLVATHNAKLIGCGVLLDMGDQIGKVVRMSVSGDFQRQGVGRRILQELLAVAKASGYHEVVLETTADWHSAIAFYSACGFSPTRLVNGDQYFRHMIFAPPYSLDTPEN
jgi:ribosomal protein S18 acetylase RimI-like enzyme